MQSISHKKKQRQLSISHIKKGGLGIMITTSAVVIIVLERAWHYLYQYVGTRHFEYLILIKKYELKHLFKFKLYSNYIYFLHSQLLFVVRRRISRNYFIYNKLNTLAKRSRIDVERLSYAC